MSIQPDSKPSTPLRALRFGAALIPLGVAGSGVLYFVLGIDPFTLLPSVSMCIFRGVTDIPCPGCGMTRALLSLGQLDIVRAMELHPFSLPLVLFALIYAFLGRVPLQRFHTSGAYLGIISLMALWVTRLLG